MSVALTFYQSPDSFRLLAPSDEKQFKLLITDIYISVATVKVRPELLVKHSQLLSEGKTVMYAYPRTCMRSHIIPKGSNQFIIRVSQILSDCVPSQLVVGLVDSEAFSGKLSKNPYLFEHFDTEQIGLTINSSNRPDIPMTLNDSYMEAYANFMEMCGGNGNGITLKDF